MQNHEKEPLDLSELTKVDYSPFFLTRNPFPAIGIPSEGPLITADRQQILNRFKEALRQTIFEDKTSITVLTGDYGSGKSHLLKYLKYRVNTQLLTSGNQAFAIYVKSVGRSFKDMYLYFIDDIGRDFLTDQALKLIRSYLKNIGDAGARKYVYEKELSKKPDLISINVEQILEGSRFCDLFHDIRKTLAGIRNSNVIYALLSLAHPNYAPVAWRWFLGESLTKDEKGLILVDDTIDDAADAQDAFRSIIAILRKSGIRAIVLLIDEFERFTLVPKQSRDQYMDDIRHFIDDNPSGNCLVIAVTPTAYKWLNEVPNALTRRLSGAEFELSFFNEDETKELIARYIQTARKENANLSLVIKDRPNISPALYPFTNDGVKRIDERAKGLVSAIINLCRDSMDAAIQSNSKVIDSRIIDSAKL